LLDLVAARLSNQAITPASAGVRPVERTPLSALPARQARDPDRSAYPIRRWALGPIMADGPSMMSVGVSILALPRGPACHWVVLLQRSFAAPAPGHLVAPLRLDFS